MKSEKIEEETKKLPEEKPKKPKVMIVVVDKKVLKLFTKTLKEEYDVIDIERPGDCITALVEERPDLLILDEEMPETNGWRMIKDIKKKSIYDYKFLRSLRIAMLSEKPPSLEIMQKRDLERLVDYITKPFEKEDIQKSVNSIFKRLSKIEKVRDQVRLRSYPVSEEYERISKALYLRRALVKPLKEELKEKTGEGSIEEIQALEKVVADCNAYINFYAKRKNEIEAMVKKWEQLKI